MLQNNENYGLGLCRNAAIDAADAPYVLPLDADNRLLPRCCEALLASIKQSGAAYAYPTIQHFGDSAALLSCAPYDPQRFVFGNYIDAMALLSKEAWAIVGGFEHIPHGWEDYDLWCRLAEIGLAGVWRDETLAEYRVHSRSMLKTETTVGENFHRLFGIFEARHPWVSLYDRHASRSFPEAEVQLTPPAERTRLDALLPILRCPTSGQKLAYCEGRTALAAVDGAIRWPIVEGRPCLAPEMSRPTVQPRDHISNELPDEALSIIRDAKGWVLNLSAGGTKRRFDHVVEVEYSIFRNTDVVADAHALPFDDATFDAAIVMNAFEHYRDPRKVACELFRVLKPGGRLHVRTAFLQPLHEPPWHFYNCTSYGLAEWFKAFETETLRVSDNFCPNHSIAWLASECEGALRKDVSSAAADEFATTAVGSLAQMWRDPSKRNGSVWKSFERLSQSSQEAVAAGFEFIGRRPAAPFDRKRDGKP